MTPWQTFMANAVRPPASRWAPEQIGRLVLRFSRAAAIEESRWVGTTAGGEHLYRAADDPDAYYRVTIGLCECPDARYRAPHGWCKHRLALWLRQAEPEKKGGEPKNETLTPGELAQLSRDLFGS